MSLGILIFSLGLFKKVVIADSFASWADIGFSSGSQLEFYDAWVTSLSYTFQLYFDFSGYCDMAMEATLLFNIRLPINFNSPYKSLDIQEFWRRWHITLGRFLRDYIYIPLGGSRKGGNSTYFNLFITFLIGGLWHGASWMFVLWGALHGGALVVHRTWKRYGGNLNSYLAWTITFFFVSFTWIFFRAENIDIALNVINGMFDISSMLSDRSSVPASQLSWLGTNVDILSKFIPFGLAANLSAVLLIMLSFIIIAQKNSVELIGDKLTNTKLLLCGVMFSLSVYMIVTSTSSVFLYFNF
ncbi:MBOAT family O-acyltransferase [Vibrio barjaei]|uniref:MBOAT family O-acyltransferase n=1 Tax=Vibrio barjaei TaxID=1676683 RepID=UPI0019D27A88|nr:MBOAT family O-acyltransferase [Vibrio barjaei]